MSASGDAEFLFVPLRIFPLAARQMRYGAKLLLGKVPVRQWKDI